MQSFPPPPAVAESTKSSSLAPTVQQRPLWAGTPGTCAPGERRPGGGPVLAGGPGGRGLATAQAGPGLRQLGWSRSAPGASGHTADSPRHLHFALRRQTPKLPGLITPGVPAPPVAHPVGRGAAGAPKHLVRPRKLFSSRIQLGTEHRSNMVCKVLIALCIFTAGTWRGPRRRGAWGRQHQAPADGKRGDTRK